MARAGSFALPVACPWAGVIDQTLALAGLDGSIGAPAASQIASKMGLASEVSNL